MSNSALATANSLVTRNLHNSSSCSSSAAVHFVAASVNINSVFSFAIFTAVLAFPFRTDELHVDTLLDSLSDFQLTHVDPDAEALKLSLSCCSS